MPKTTAHFSKKARSLVVPLVEDIFQAATSCPHHPRGMLRVPAAGFFVGGHPADAAAHTSAFPRRVIATPTTTTAHTLIIIVLREVEGQQVTAARVGVEAVALVGVRGDEAGAEAAATAAQAIDGTIEVGLDTAAAVAAPYLLPSVLRLVLP